MGFEYQVLSMYALQLSPLMFWLYISTKGGSRLGRKGVHNTRDKTEVYYVLKFWEKVIPSIDVIFVGCSALVALLVAYNVVMMLEIEVINGRLGCFENLMRCYLVLKSFIGRHKSVTAIYPLCFVSTC